MHFSGGLISKPNTLPAEVISIADAAMDDIQSKLDKATVVLAATHVLQVCATKSEKRFQHALVDTLGSLHVIEGRAAMMQNYVDKGAVPAEEAAAIRAERVKAHKRICVALNFDGDNAEQDAATEKLLKELRDE